MRPAAVYDEDESKLDCAGRQAGEQASRRGERGMEWEWECVRSFLRGERLFPAAAAAADAADAAQPLSSLPLPSFFPDLSSPCASSHKRATLNRGREGRTAPDGGRRAEE